MKNVLAFEDYQMRGGSHYHCAKLHYFHILYSTLTLRDFSYIMHRITYSGVHINTEQFSSGVTIVLLLMGIAGPESY